jgi:hypothetical protein
MQTAWKVVTAWFVIVLMVAAGVTIERAAERKRRSPSGLGQFQKSSYAITEKSGEYNMPRLLVDTSSWKSVNLERLGVEVKVPGHWVQRGGGLGSRSASFVFDSALQGSREFVISLFNNPQDYGEQQFIWRDVLDGEISMAGAISAGAVELPTPWVIDNVEARSLYYSGSGKQGEYVAMTRGSKMLVFYVEDMRFSPSNPQLYSVLSTAKLSE